MELSIIIALYNTEQYIEKCIRSIYENNNLSLESFEVIVINDGSTDESPYIVEKLQKEFSNIQLINKENGGQSTARNIGFNIAKGEYIYCLDSDDSLNASELVAALEYAQTKALDMVPIYFRMYSINGSVIKNNNDNYEAFSVPLTGGQFMKRYVISGAMWRYLYRTTIIRSNNLKLTEGIFHEDEEFVIKFMSYSDRIAYNQHNVYNYVIHQQSTVNKKDRDHREKLLYDILIVIEKLINHRKKFEAKSDIYYGISKKIEQLSVTVFLRMKEDGLLYKATAPFEEKLSEMGCFPFNITYNNLKFKAFAFFLNIQMFRKLYYM